MFFYIIEKLNVQGIAMSLQIYRWCKYNVPLIILKVCCVFSFESPLKVIQMKTHNIPLFCGQQVIEMLPMGTIDHYTKLQMVLALV